MPDLIVRVYQVTQICSATNVAYVKGSVTDISAIMNMLLIDVLTDDSNVLSFY